VGWFKRFLEYSADVAEGKAHGPLEGLWLRLGGRWLPDGSGYVVLAGLFTVVVAIVVAPRSELGPERWLAVLIPGLVTVLWALYLWLVTAFHNRRR
jgi:hypothetical protein